SGDHLFPFRTSRQAGQPLRQLLRGVTVTEVAQPGRCHPRGEQPTGVAVQPERVATPQGCELARFLQAVGLALPGHRIPAVLCQSAVVGREGGGLREENILLAQENVPGLVICPGKQVVQPLHGKSPNRSDKQEFIRATDPSPEKSRLRGRHSSAARPFGGAGGKGGNQRGVFRNRSSAPAAATRTLERWSWRGGGGRGSPARSSPSTPSASAAASRTQSASGSRARRRGSTARVSRSAPRARAAASQTRSVRS